MIDRVRLDVALLQTVRVSLPPLKSLSAPQAQKVTFQYRQKSTIGLKSYFGFCLK